MGPRYDQKLREVYTGVTQADILEERRITAAIWDDAMANNRPLWRLLDKYIDQRMLEDIAAQYKLGRLLLVATTNLDSQVPVIWNLTKIAASGKPGSLALFRSLIGKRVKPPHSWGGRRARRLVPARCRRKPSLAVNAAFAAVRCTGG